jgi:hypothetical protein
MAFVKENLLRVEIFYHLNKNAFLSFNIMPIEKALLFMLHYK